MRAIARAEKKVKTNLATVLVGCHGKPEGHGVHSGVFERRSALPSGREALFIIPLGGPPLIWKAASLTATIRMVDIGRRPIRAAGSTMELRETPAALFEP